jgi:hypothetical protein
MSSAAEIKKVLTGGTPHQRATLLANHYALWITPDQKAALTEEEVSALDESFKTDFDLRVYKKFKELDEIFRFRLTGLSSLRIEYELVETRIVHTNFTRFILQQTEDLLASISFLVSEECGAEKQVAIWKKLTKKGAPSFFPIGTKPELELKKGDDGETIAYVRLKGSDLPKNKDELLAAISPAKKGKIDFSEFSYVAVIVDYGQQLMTLRRLIKTWIVTLREVMQEHRFNIRPYKQFMDSVEKVARKEIPLPFTQGPDELRARVERDPKDKTFLQLLNEDKQIRELFWKTYDEIELDEKWRKDLLENFNLRAITNGPK